MIGYYVHHHGFGHLARASSIAARMNLPVTALSSLPISEPHPFAAVVALPRDDNAAAPREQTAHGALHWSPHHDAGLTARMSAVAQWVTHARPRAVVVDVSVEIAAFVRLLGVPVVVVALPGTRTDHPHRLVHQLADHIVAAWPRELYEPRWLRAHLGKTSFVGGISRFEDRKHERPTGEPLNSVRGPRVLVLGGGVGDNFTVGEGYAQAQSSWTVLGAADGHWVADPWPYLSAADVVIAHAGQGAIADIAAAQKAAIVVPRPRPFDEQRSTAEVLRRHRLAVVVDRPASAAHWPALLAQACAADPTRWRRWEVEGAASRAARAIEKTADRYAVGTRV